ncbi:MAG TPA: arginine--tRNA ligase [Chloroflexota bacterium]|jgi:arginyl-tRNA synthetase|nr:arginine--tRNA ligase [Chloroflexota bacterium]
MSDPIHEFETEIRGFLTAQGVDATDVSLSVPPEPEFGEAASNAAFLLAKSRRLPPRTIAGEIVASFDPSTTRFIRRAESAGAGFINFFLNYESFVPHALGAIESSGTEFGRPGALRSKNILIEHTSINPNKEWHVGHLRNVVIGDVLVRVSRLAGHTVEVQNYIDDTGRQAAEAIYALELYEPPPMDPDDKFDHYVGRYYVRLNGELTDPDTPERAAELEAGIERVLHDMEAGRYRDRVEEILGAQLETAVRLGATYDLLVWESDIIHAQLLDEALGLLRKSPVVFVPEEGEYKDALVIKLQQVHSKAEPVESEPRFRVLVRSNGIPTYTGKDTPYMMWKFGLLKAQLESCRFEVPTGSIRTTCPNGEPFLPKSHDEVINVVGEHQALQQQTVIEGLAAAGYAKEAKAAHHLSYGMVSQAHGKISGRKGSGISADDVLDEAVAVAKSRITDKQPELGGTAGDAIAEAVAVGSVRYLMAQYSPVKTITFDLRDVVSFEGNTGLYLQYAMVRMSAIVRRADAEHGISDRQIDGGDAGLLVHPAEQRLLVQLTRFPAAVEDVSRTFGINLIAEFAHSLASEFSQFYRDCPILPADPPLRLARLRLLRATRIVLTNALALLGIPVVDRL